jgi:hypothetical protein
MKGDLPLYQVQSIFPMVRRTGFSDIGLPIVDWGLSRNNKTGHRYSGQQKNGEPHHRDTALAPSCATYDYPVFRACHPASYGSKYQTIGYFEMYIKMNL